MFAHKSKHRALLLNNKPTRGVTLIELLVVLVILSILAAAAMPYAEITIKRNKEVELHAALRRIRTAIDDFHEDWKAGKIIKDDDVASNDGYPVNLEIMIEGVDTTGIEGGKRYYLRRIPADPFSDSSLELSEQWNLRSYQDEPGTTSWGGEDVYDIASKSERTAIDGTKYKDW